MKNYENCDCFQKTKNVQGRKGLCEGKDIPITEETKKCCKGCNKYESKKYKREKDN